MTIKEAKQNGSTVIVKYGNSSSSFNNSKLIGYTPNALFIIQNNKTIYTYNERNGSLVVCSSRIDFKSNSTAKVCGNTLEVKVGTTRQIYDEKGNKIKTICG